MVKGLSDGENKISSTEVKNCLQLISYLDNVQFHDHIYRDAYFVFKAVHFEAHALKNHFGTSSYRDLLE